MVLQDCEYATDLMGTEAPDTRYFDRIDRP